MTDREEQIVEVIRRSVKPIADKERPEDWWMRLWKAAFTATKTEHDGDLLYHECLTYIAGRSGGWMGREYALKALEAHGTQNGA